MRYTVEVIAGKGRGKGIGFPTLNLTIPSTLNLKYGIYAGYVFIEHTRFSAAIHFGPVPTFHESVPTLEAYLLDTEVNVPPHELQIELIAFIRKIQAFKNSDELTEQIVQDVTEVKNVLARVIL